MSPCSPVYDDRLRDPDAPAAGFARVDSGEQHGAFHRRGGELPTVEGDDRAGDTCAGHMLRIDTPWLEPKGAFPATFQPDRLLEAREVVRLPGRLGGVVEFGRTAYCGAYG